MSAGQNESRITFAFMYLLFVVLVSTNAYGQNLEAGVHGGWANLGDDTPLGSESAGEFGVWLNLWPSDRLAIAADWAYISRESFEQRVGQAVFGERDRNRQIVDLTLRQHFLVMSRLWLYAEAGGGFLWNNRQVDNPSGLPGFEESGKESTRKTIVTIGAGFRAELMPHLAWVTGVKFHNPGSDSTHTERVVTGLVLSWK